MKSNECSPLPKSRWLAWILDVEEDPVPHLLDLRKSTNFTSRIARGRIAEVEFSQDDSKLALVFDGPRYNLDVWILDLTTFKLRQLRIQPSRHSFLAVRRAGIDPL